MKNQSELPTDNEEYILMTYRSGIEKKLPTTYYESDAGWGCMLRVGQMFLANLLFKIELVPKKQIIKLCYDNQPMPFSLQMITQVATKICPNKKQYEWFSPCQCGFILKDILDEFDQKYRVSICNDNCIFLDQIQADRDKLIVLVMCRIGLDEPQPEYLKCILQLMKNPYFNTILGGTPKKAHLFIKHRNGHLGFLDPHNTRKVPKIEQLEERESQFVSKLSWIPEEKIDCSMALSFCVPKTHVDSFWESLEQTKTELGQSFFLYLAKQKPTFDEDEMGIIEIDDNQF